MELALYHPAHGYYEQSNSAIGRGGDFFTSVSVGDLFGKLLAFQFAEWLPPEETVFAGSRSCQIVEAGAHDGRLAFDILDFFTAHRQALLERMEYWIIEPSARRRKQQLETLKPFAAKVSWFEGWNQVPDGGVRGIIFANELLDAMPVHRLGWDAVRRQWFEWGVGMSEDRFVWVRMRECSSEKLAGLIDCPELSAEVERILSDGFIVETCPPAVEWWSQAAKALSSGRLLTLDYGQEARGLIRPERTQGTLRAYWKHRATDNLLAHVGEQDLTADVNFDAIRRAGEAVGLRTEVISEQGRFLTRVAETIWRGRKPFPPWTKKWTRQFRTLTHPAQMGEVFRVLVQSRTGPVAI